MPKAKIMTSSPITSWQIDGEKWKQWQILFSWAPKSLQVVTPAMKLRHLLLRRKAITNLNNLLKIRDITLLTKVHPIKAIVFLGVMYGCESWAIKKAEHWRTDAFKLWCCRRLLRVPWTARRSNQSMLKESNSDYSLEGLMLKQKLQYFGHLIRRADSLEKTLMPGKIEDRRKRWWQIVGWHHQLNGYEFEQTLGGSEGQRSLVCYSPCHRKVSDTTERLNKTTKFPSQGASL